MHLQGEYCERDIRLTKFIAKEVKQNLRYLLEFVTTTGRILFGESS